MLLVLALFGSSSFFANGTETNAVPRNIDVLAKSIRLPEFRVDAVPFAEMVRKLHDASKQHDPDHKGFNFLVTNTSGTNAYAYPKVTLNLKNVTVAEATEIIAVTSRVRVTAHDFGFVFSPEMDSEH